MIHRHKRKSSFTKQFLLLFRKFCIPHPRNDSHSYKREAIVFRKLQQHWGIIIMPGPNLPNSLQAAITSPSPLLNWVKLKYSSASYCHPADDLLFFPTVLASNGHYRMKWWEGRNSKWIKPSFTAASLLVSVRLKRLLSLVPKTGTCGRKLVGKLGNAMHHPHCLPIEIHDIVVVVVHCRRLEDRAREQNLTTIDLFHSTSY